MVTGMCGIFTTRPRAPRRPAPGRGAGRPGPRRCARGPRHGGSARADPRREHPSRRRAACAPSRKGARGRHAHFRRDREHARITGPEPLRVVENPRERHGIDPRALGDDIGLRLGELDCREEIARDANLVLRHAAHLPRVAAAHKNKGAVHAGDLPARRRLVGFLGRVNRCRAAICSRPSWSAPSRDPGRPHSVSSGWALRAADECDSPPRRRTRSTSYSSSRARPAPPGYTAASPASSKEPTFNDISDGSLSGQLLGEETVEETAGAIGRGVGLGPREGAPARGEIEALVLLAAAGQRAPREIPGEAEDARTLLGADALGPMEEALDERTQGGIGELGCGRRGEEIVRAEETDDLVHAWEPQWKEASEGAEGTSIGEPHPRSPLVGA